MKNTYYAKLVESLLIQREEIKANIEALKRELDSLAQLTHRDKRENVDKWEFVTKQKSDLSKQINKLNKMLEFNKHNVQESLKYTIVPINEILKPYVGRTWRKPLSEKIINDIKTIVGVNFYIIDEMIYILNNDYLGYLKFPTYYRFENKKISLIPTMELNLIKDYEMAIEEMDSVETQLDSLAEQMDSLKTQLRNKYDFSLVANIIYKYR